MFYRSGWLRCVGLMSVDVILGFERLEGIRLYFIHGWCLVRLGFEYVFCGLKVICVYYILYISYTILFLLSLLSSFLSPPNPNIQSIRVGTYIRLFILYYSIPSSPLFFQSFSSSFSSSLPLISFSFSLPFLPYSSIPSLFPSHPSLLLPSFPILLIHSIRVGTYIHLFIFSTSINNSDPACFIGVDG